MILHMICTRDIVSNVWSTPIFVPHVGQAIRSFGDECRRKEKGNTLGEHPEDFELWHLGEYDDNTAHFHTEHSQPNPFTPKQIAVGANYRD